MNNLKISVIAPYERPWSDVELVKECILIPYILYKDYGYEVTIVGASPQGIPAGSYYEKDIGILSDNFYKNYKYVSGLKFRLFDSWDEKARLEYIEKNIRDIDILYLRGPYELNIQLPPFYKKLKPDGKVYCALDANSSWMDSIYWYLPEFMDFMNSIDIITTSCAAMADFLSIKWPWHIHSIRNGFYDLTVHHRNKVNFDDRENIILQVGRLEFKDKATDVLLEAFKKASDYIPDWKLCLVGSIVDEFKTYLHDFLEQNNAIKDRIIIPGSISERDDLASYYDRAKIYALTSKKEGGTNNATAEALGRGLIPVTSRIDAYEDITDHGNLGGSFDTDDVEELAKVPIDLCNHRDLRLESEKVYAYANKEYNLEKIAGKVDELIKGNK